MKRIFKILGLLFVGGSIFVVGLYAHMEPQTWIGGLYLRGKYDPDDHDLRGISDHLAQTNGGYIPRDFDTFLNGRLIAADEGSDEYRNILGFCAHQSKLSRASSWIFDTGDEYLASIIEYGRKSPGDDRQLGFLFLAYGIAVGEQVYKPSFYSNKSIAENFDFIESGDHSKVTIMSP